MTASIGGGRRAGRQRRCWREDMREDMRRLNADNELCEEREIWKLVEYGVSDSDPTE